MSTYLDFESRQGVRSPCTYASKQASKQTNYICEMNLLVHFLNIVSTNKATSKP